MQCESKACEKWRLLRGVSDPSEIASTWTCSESTGTVRDEDKLGMYIIRWVWEDVGGGGWEGRGMNIIKGVWEGFGRGLGGMWQGCGRDVHN